MVIKWEARINTSHRWCVGRRLMKTIALRRHRKSQYMQACLGPGMGMLNGICINSSADVVTEVIFMCV